MTSVAERAPASDGERFGAGAGEIARDIARGGLAGLVAGVIVGGLGGRVAMRLAALAVPDSAGRFTENGNEIGAITLGGSLGLFLFGGLFAGAAAGVVWVTVSPWIPELGIRRAVLTMPIAVALAGVFLVEGDNLDFLVLRNNPFVVALLLALIACLGLAVAWLDDVLERRLPGAGTGRPAVTFIYAVVVAIGLIFLPLVVGAYFSSPPIALVGLALGTTGAATVVWWGLRLRGGGDPPRRLVLVGRTALAVAVVLGTVALIPEVAEALGIS
jgi:hypothetical protein